MGGTTGTDLRLIQRIPLATRAEHEQDGIHGFAIIKSEAGLNWFVLAEKKTDSRTNG